MQEPLPQSICQRGMWCHLAGLGGILLVIILPIPYLNLLVPYIVWEMGRNLHPFVDEQGKESMNFQLSLSIYFTAYLILAAFLLLVTCGVMMGSGGGYQTLNQFFIVMAVLLGVIVVAIPIEIGLVIFAAVKAAQGQSYRYPFTLRFFR